jgi:hypothetical protein
MRWKGNRKVQVIVIIVAVLVVFRLALPYIVTRYVNKVLGDLEGYRGQIHDVDIHLIRGAYQIDSLRVFKINGNKEVPFIDVPVMDLSVEWEALFNGRVVGEVEFRDAALNFIAGKKEKGKGETGSEQTGDDVDWTIPIKKLMPLKINRLTIRNGNIMFYDFTTKPQVDLSLHHVELVAENLDNARNHKDMLPSKVSMQARSIGNGLLTINMKINVLKKLPDLDMNLKFEQVYMPALNDFFDAYASVDVEKGSFNLYSEVAVLDGKVTGYVKPLFNDLKVIDWKKDKDKPLELVWESIAGFLVEIFENQSKDQFATRVPLQGQIAEVKSPFWPTLWNIFRNAFIEAFEKNTDNTINIASTENADTQIKSKKDLRKERREKRKEERREKRAAKREKKKGESG